MIKNLIKGSKVVLIWSFLSLALPIHIGEPILENQINISTQINIEVILNNYAKN